MADDDVIITPQKRDQSFPVQAGTTVFRLGRAVGRVREFEDAIFHFDSAVLLPDSGPCDPSKDDEDRITGIGVLATCLQQAHDDPEQSILVAGHTDTKGPDWYNRLLSHDRAKNVHCALTGNKKDWVDIAKARHQVEDYQQILKWIAFIWAWPCDPGEITNVHDEPTDKAVEAFQTLASTEFGEPLTVDGDVGKQTWGAIFRVYMRVLADLLDITEEELAERQKQLKFVPKKFVGCGESFQVEHIGEDEVECAANRRVQVIFFDEGEEPKLRCHPSPGSCKKERCDLYTNTTFSLEYLPCPPLRLSALDFKAELVEIAGLYQPKAKAMVGDYQSDYVEGYKSDDDWGRIFVNHSAGSGSAIDWESLRKKNTQYIELKVRITANNGRLSPQTTVIWTWEDPDDPSNAGMHGAASTEVDDESGGKGNDNEGQRDFPGPDAGKGAKFEAMPGFAFLSEADEHTCETPLDGELSRVRLHVTNVAGDNFRVKVTAKDPRGGTARADTTGVMTMWKRIDVEYKVMVDAENKLPADEIPGAFEECFVQMDLHGPTSIGDANTREVLLTNPKLSLSDAARDYTNLVFDNAGKPGWFLLVAAHHAQDPVKAKELYEGKADVRVTKAKSNGYGGAELVLPTVLSAKDPPSTARYIEGGNGITLGLSKKAKIKGKKTVIAAYPLDYQPTFDVDAMDGAYENAYGNRHMYYPTHMVKVPGGATSTPGLGFSSSPSVKVKTRGATFTIGISPPLKKKVGSKTKKIFAGRTIIFTRKGSKKRMLEVIVHEFGHAFGFPHKCGYYAARNESKQSCTMNYFNTWVFAEGTMSIEKRFFTGKSSNRLCARHINGIRRVHLEDNVALWTWP